MPDLTPDRSLRRPSPPGAQEAVVRTGRRRRHRVLLSGALVAAVLTAVPVGVLATSSPDPDRLLADAPPSAPPSAAPSPPPAQPCPATYLTEGEFPAPLPPPELEGALVPEAVPLAVTICRYGDIQFTGGGQSPTRPEQVPLDGERMVLGGLERLPGDLAVAAASPGDEGRRCTLIGGAVIPYLVQLRYVSSTVWLSAVAEPNSCSGVSNGAFVSDVYVGGQVAAAFDAGRWVPPPTPWNAPDPGACPLPATGRAGQERDLVPAGWQTIRVCRSEDGVQRSTVVDDDAVRRLLALLDALPTRRVAGFSADCGDLGPPARTTPPPPYFEVQVEYPSGRAVRLYTSFRCEPTVGNGSLAGTMTPEQQVEPKLLEGD